MSHQAFALLVLHAQSNHEELRRIEGALNLIRRKGKTKGEAKRARSQLKTLRYLMTQNSQS